MPLNIKAVIEEVEKGLATEANKRMQSAREALDMYDYQGEAELLPWLRGYDSPFDLKQKPYNESGLMQEIVNVLTDHLYSPGPSRTWSESAGQEFLHRVYSDNHIDSVMQECDVLSTVGDAAAVQVDANEGLFEDKPITLRVWGADEFHAWEDPDNRNIPAAVVTKDMYDQQTRYRLWTETELRTFLTAKGDGTAGGRVAKQVGPTEPNPYQCLPFTFTHYKYPVRTFWRPGIGDFLRRAEVNANVLLSRLSSAIIKYIDPLPYIKDGWPGMRITVESQGFVIFPGPQERHGQKGVERVEGPTPDFLQAHPDVASAWEHIRSLYVQTLKACGVPQSAVDLDYSAAPSGIMLIINKWPLLERARKRRGPYGIYEADLARTTLRCAGNYYGRPDLVNDAKTGTLALGWPTPATPITQDWLDTERQKVEMGVSSLIMVVMAMHGVDREKAVGILKEVKDDQDEVEKINPDLKAQEPDTETESPNGQQRIGNGQPATAGNQANQRGRSD